MAEKTHTKPLPGSFKVKPTGVYRSADGGWIVPGSMVVYHGDAHPPTGRRGNAYIKTRTVHAEIADEARYGMVIGELKSGGTFVIYGRSEDRDSFQAARELAQDRLSKSTLASQAGETVRQKEKAARKERMNRAFGMWAHIEQDSVEMQKELREDWL